MRTLSFVILGCFLAVAGIALAESTFAPFRVVTHPENPTKRVDRKFLSDAFLKKSRYWRDGEVIRPVDLSADSSTRKSFSEDVLHRSIPAVRSYWHQMVFSGRELPPPELNSDEQVLEFVRSHPGAIGYISPGANATGVTVMTVE